MNNQRVIEAVKDLVAYNEATDYDNIISIVSPCEGKFEYWLGDDRFREQDIYQRLGNLPNVELPVIYTSDKPEHYGEDHPHKVAIIEWAKGAPIEFYHMEYKRWMPTIGSPSWILHDQYRVAAPEPTEKEKAQEKLKELLSKAKELEEQIEKM